MFIVVVYVRGALLTLYKPKIEALGGLVTMAEALATH